MDGVPLSGGVRTIRDDCITWASIMWLCFDGWNFEIGFVKLVLHLQRKEGSARGR